MTHKMTVILTAKINDDLGLNKLTKPLSLSHHYHVSQPKTKTTKQIISFHV